MILAVDFIYIYIDIKFGEYKVLVPLKVEFHGTIIDTLTKSGHPSISNIKQSIII